MLIFPPCSLKLRDASAAGLASQPVTGRRPTHHDRRQNAQGFPDLVYVRDVVRVAVGPMTSVAFSALINPIIACAQG